MVFISRAYTRIAPESQAALLPAQSLDRRAHRRRSLVRRGQRPRRAIAQAFPPAAPAGGETRSTGFGSAPCKFSMRIILRKSELRAMLFSFAGWSPLGRALLGGRTGGLHLCC